MAVSKEQVLATAKLARLDLAAGLSPEEAESTIARLAEQMGKIVAYMAILEQADTAGVEPLYSPMLHVAPPRADVAEAVRTVDETLENAPSRQGDFFAVPPVI